MAQSSTEHHMKYQARRLAIRLHPPCVYLEYEEQRKAQPPKPRVRTVNLPVLHGHEDVADLVKKVLLSFPRHLDPATVKHQELHSLVYKLVAHAAQQQGPVYSQHDSKGQIQTSMQRPHKAKLGMAGSSAKPLQRFGEKVERLSLDNAPMIVSVLRSITRCPAGTALAQQLQADADAGPVQRCVQLLDWVFDVYSHIPASHLKAVPVGSAPSPALEASIAASVQCMSKQSVEEDKKTEGLICAYRPGSLPDSSQKPEASVTSSTNSSKSSSDNTNTMAPSNKAGTGSSTAPVVGAVAAAASKQDITAAPLGTPNIGLMLQATRAADSAQQRNTVQTGSVQSAWAPKSAAGEGAGRDSVDRASTISGMSSSSAVSQRCAAPAAPSDDEDDCLTLEVEVRGDVDLNKVSDYELKLAKEAMNKDFQKALLRPGDAGFEYDRQIDFAPAVEANEWDDDASASDESVF